MSWSLATSLVDVDDIEAGRPGAVGPLSSLARDMVPTRWRRHPYLALSSRREPDGRVSVQDHGGE